MEFKKTLLYIFFSGEMLIFIFFYTFGTNGIQALRHIEKENQLLRQKNNILKEEIQRLEQVCGDWEYSSFYKEKIARERLHMARADDVIYYLQ